MQYSFKPRFNAPILAGTKIHTFRRNRKDKRLPKVGSKLTFCNGARTKYYYRIPFTAKCYGSQKVRMVITVKDKAQFFPYRIDIHIGSKRKFYPIELWQMAINDGFAGLNDFCEYWLEGKEKVVFSGYCHHWTDFKYE